MDQYTVEKRNAHQLALDALHDTRGLATSSDRIQQEFVAICKLYETGSGTPEGKIAALQHLVNQEFSEHFAVFAGVNPPGTPMDWTSNLQKGIAELRGVDSELSGKAYLRLLQEYHSGYVKTEWLHAAARVFGFFWADQWAAMTMTAYVPNVGDLYNPDNAEYDWVYKSEVNDINHILDLYDHRFNHTMPNGYHGHVIRNYDRGEDWFEVFDSEHILIAGGPIKDERYKEARSITEHYAAIDAARAEEETKEVAKILGV